MAQATQRHKLRITHDHETHETHVLLDGRELPGIRRADVALRAHDAEIHLVFGEGVDIEIEADTPHIDTQRDPAAN